MKKALAIININAGRKKAIKYKRKLLTFLRKNYDEYKVVTVDELKTLAVNEFDTVIAIGGDGTINKALPLVVNTDRKLGIIPCGTANLLASKLKIPNSIDKCLEIIKNGAVKKIDAMYINEKPSVLRVGFGYDAEIICKTPQSMKNKFGYFAYFMAGILFALRLKNKFYTMKIDNETTKKVKASCIIIANASNMYKNLVSVASKSYLDDGLIDIFILKTQNPILFFIEFLKILFNIKTSSKRAEYIKVKSIEIKNKWRYSHIDGEKIKFNDDICISILSKNINVCVKN